MEYKTLTPISKSPISQKMKLKKNIVYLTQVDIYVKPLGILLLLNKGG